MEKYMGEEHRCVFCNLCDSSLQLAPNRSFENCYHGFQINTQYNGMDTSGTGELSHGMTLESKRYTIAHTHHFTRITLHR